MQKVNVEQHEFLVYLPRPDGSRDVWCENAYRKVRPCDQYITLDADNKLTAGLIVNLPNGSLRFCSFKCVTSYAARTQK